MAEDASGLSILTLQGGWLAQQCLNTGGQATRKLNKDRPPGQKAHTGIQKWVPRNLPRKNCFERLNLSPCAFWCIAKQRKDQMTFGDRCGGIVRCDM